MRKFSFSFSMFPVAGLGYVHIHENIIYHIHAVLKVRIIPIIIIFMANNYIKQAFYSLFWRKKWAFAKSLSEF